MLVWLPALDCLSYFGLPSPVFVPRLVERSHHLRIGWQIGAARATRAEAVILVSIELACDVVPEPDNPFLDGPRKPPHPGILLPHEPALVMAPNRAEALPKPEMRRRMMLSHASVLQFQPLALLDDARKRQFAA